jgi:tocopherol O-methyltransferase
MKSGTSDIELVTGYIDKRKIIEHYDIASPYYRKLWGEHLHHGYWRTGSETKEEAQAALTTYLAQAAQIKPGAEILDVGCGFGASSIHLARKHQASVVGISISLVQTSIAHRAANNADVIAHFAVMDADEIALQAEFDVIWCIESISHFENKPHFFTRAAQMLRPGGTLAIIDWFRSGSSDAPPHRACIRTIERGMLVKLRTMSDYADMSRKAGLEVLVDDDLSDQCGKTWEITGDLLKNRSLSQLAKAQPIEFIRFLRSAKAMRTGFAHGCFVYGMLIARK